MDYREMTAVLNKDRPALFIGVADFLQSSGAPFPFGVVDLFQLSQHKSHIVYPGTIAGHEWVILVSTEFLENCDLNKWQLRIADEDDAELSNVSFSGISNVDDKLKSGAAETREAIAIPKGSDFIMLHVKVDSLVCHPGRYVVQSIYDGKVKPIGSVHFHYQKAPSLTPDQIKAIESDPNSVTAISMKLGCKSCPTKLNVYTGLKRSPLLEKDGFLWQTDLGGEFNCQCGKTRYSLQYLKESMHGLLLKDFSREISGLGYVRQYGHSQVVKIIEKFTALLNDEPLEPQVQKFLEQYPILLSRFHAKRLFFKPNIVGRFEADFAVVDSRDQLWFIELEKPSMPLFKKKDGHPRSELMHAYGQVADWLIQYGKYSGAILEKLGLKPHEIVAVRGVVIAGRSTSVSHEVLQRHLSNPPYPNIEFLTLDDLGTSLLEISKKLA